MADSKSSKPTRRRKSGNRFDVGGAGTRGTGARKGRGRDPRLDRDAAAVGIGLGLLGGLGL